MIRVIIKKVCLNNNYSLRDRVEPMRAHFRERDSQLIKVTLHQLFAHGLLSREAACSITEVEVVVGVVVVLTLSDN